jgi:hypothetical protein
MQRRGPFAPSPRFADASQGRDYDGGKGPHPHSRPLSSVLSVVWLVCIVAGVRRVWPLRWEGRSPCLGLTTAHRSLLPPATTSHTAVSRRRVAEPRPRNVRSLGYPSEAVYETGVDGCVAFFAPAVGLRRRLRSDPSHPSVSPRPSPPLPGCSVTSAFPSIASAPTLDLTVVMPAYNEEDRMRAGIDEALAHLKAAAAAAAATTGGENSTTAPSPAAFTWELIIVDDGSKDATAAVAMDIVRSEGSERVRLLRLHANSGKGAAVPKGSPARPRTVRAHGRRGRRDALRRPGPAA